MSDPRVYFAAERTLLAWIRTGITVIAPGFVVSRFAPFLRLVADPRGGALSDLHSRWVSNLLGLSLVLTGPAVIINQLACSGFW